MGSGGYKKIEIMGVPVFVAALHPGGHSPEDLASIAAEVAGCDATIVAGVPGGRSLDYCTVVVSYLHALEAKSRGSRVRSLSLLFLMELLGVGQVRDIVDLVESEGVGLVIVASLDEQCLREALERVGTSRRELEECDPDRLSRVVVGTVLQGPRLE